MWPKDFYSNKFPGDAAASGGLDTGPETLKYNCEVNRSSPWVHGASFVVEKDR